MSEQAYTRLRDVMTPSPIIIDGLATVSDAVDLMREKGVSSLVIDRRHEGDEYGIVLTRNIGEKVVGLGRSAERVNVYEIMTKPVLSLDADMNIKYALRSLVGFNLTRALVLDKGELVGIVTLRDLVLRSVGPRTGGSS